jgi:hypothetical protein
MTTIVAAIIGTVGGLVTGILVTWLATRLREPNPQLGYVFHSTYCVSAKALGRLRRGIAMTYEDTPVKSLYVCKASFRNTGTQILTGVRLSFVAPEEGKLLTPDIDVPEDVQLGKHQLIRRDDPRRFRYNLGHILLRDRFDIVFLAADTDPNDIAISVERPPSRLKKVGRLETPVEQIGAAFRSDPARFTLQLFLPLLVAATAIAAGLLAALMGGGD